MIPEVDEILSARTRLEATCISNKVALQASRGQRPMADADACRSAFAERFAADLMNQQVNITPPKSGYWGD